MSGHGGGRKPKLGNWNKDGWPIEPVRSWICVGACEGGMCERAREWRAEGPVELRDAPCPEFRIGRYGGSRRITQAEYEARMSLKVGDKWPVA